jgi:SAM-dependent methyltransferase
LFDAESSDRTTASGCLKIGEREIPIIESIPRFVQSENYATNFGIQWNAFKKTQYDSYTGLPLTSDRFWHNTKWTPEELKGKKILEAGCGAGRFTEIFLEAGADVVSFDLSDAVDVNYSLNKNKGNLIALQASIYDVPLKDNFFDYVFCYGVLQHTPDPEKAYINLFNKLKPGGKISVDYYLKTDQLVPWSTPKYFWRKYTTPMDPQKLLRLIRFYIPFWLPIDTLIRRIPKIGTQLSALTMIPCWNYVNLPLRWKDKLEWAIMDTFDALGAAYDEPKTLDEVRDLVDIEQTAFVEVFYGSNGVVANCMKE